MHNKHKILVIEDEIELAKSTLNFLQENGFIAFHASTLNKAKSLLKQEHVNVVLLDLGLPDGDGMSLIKKIKGSKKEIGLIIVSAQDTLDKKIKGLDLGADDYLTKPYFLPELKARLNAVIRRLNLDSNNEISANEISLFPDEMRVVVNNNQVDLTAKEFELLLYFMSNQNRVISKTTLGEYMSSSYLDYGFTDDMLYTHVKNLKKKLSNYISNDYIKNVYGVGYKFEV